MWWCTLALSYHSASSHIISQIITNNKWCLPFEVMCLEYIMMHDVWHSWHHTSPQLYKQTLHQSLDTVTMATLPSSPGLLPPWCCTLSKTTASSTNLHKNRSTPWRCFFCWEWHLFVSTFVLTRCDWQVSYPYTEISKSIQFQYTRLYLIKILYFVTIINIS